MRTQPSAVAADDADLRADVRRLGDLLGQTLVRQEGPELLALVEQVRKAVREGDDILDTGSVICGNDGLFDAFAKIIRNA